MNSTNCVNSFLPRIAIMLPIAIAVWVGASCAGSIAAEQKPAKDGKPQKKEEKKPKKLTGAELYAVHCNRCHPERYAPERTAAQWKTILTHMRVRANLPAEQAKAIMQFLQEDSGK